ncbi:MAG TPA: hypothetical protein VG937_01140 [Polyangiaceae bacterium]|nr:hypothetical protein [Polyangiaceae bacterium]
MTSDKPRYAWVLNLDAELELAQKGYTPRARLLAQLEQYGADSRRLLGPGDVLVRGTEKLAPDLGFVGRAWCPTPRALALLAASGVNAEPHPTADVLRRVNHRRFAFELGGGLPGQRYLVDKSELDAHLRNADSPLLLKRPLAFAGRGQLRVYAHQRITEKEWSWIDVSLRNDGLIVEPLVVPTLEFSLHGFVWPNTRRELGQPCIQEVSTRGVFRGVRRALSTDLDAEEERALFEQGERVAAAVASAGYFGPFGIDGYRYEHDGRVGLCALSEINARYTMGFLTGFPRHPSELWLG